MKIRSIAIAALAAISAQAFALTATQVADSATVKMYVSGASALRNEVPPGLKGLWAELARGPPSPLGLPVYAKLCHPFCAPGSASDGVTCLQQGALLLRLALRFGNLAVLDLAGLREVALALGLLQLELEPFGWRPTGF